MAKKSTTPSKRRQTKIRRQPPIKAPAAQVPVLRRVRFFITIALLFIAAGVLLAYLPIFRQQSNIQKVASAPAPAPVRTPQVEAATKTTETISGKPNRIVIPSLDIDLKIADGIYNSSNQSWTLSNDKAHYALMTPEPNNQNGNTFIYGHNRPGVFATLSKLKIGETVTIYTDNGHKFTYKYRSAYETNPNDDSLFQYQGSPILTLQTCSGLWYQNRLLMTFDLIRVV